MDFGRLDISSVQHAAVDLAPVNGKALARRTPPGPRAKLFLGAPMWSNEGFRGTIYPRETSKSHFLKIYAEQFDSIELNSTFYALPSQEVIKSWVNEVSQINPSFKFCPKISKSISHEGRLDAHFEALPRYIETLKGFGDHLGICFLQLHEGFSSSRFQELTGFIEMWPKEMPLAVELRHPVWFKPGPLQDRLIEVLIRHSVSWVVTDTPGRQDVLHPFLTHSKVLIRFVTTQYQRRDQLRLQNWAKRVLDYVKNGASEVYFFSHEMEDSLYLSPLKDLEKNLSGFIDVRAPIDYSDVHEPQQLDLFLWD